MKLYYSPGACSQAAHIALYESCLPFTVVRVDIDSKKIVATGEDYLAIAPKGAVPALEMEGGQILTEGAAVLHYIADQAPATHLMPPMTPVLAIDGGEITMAGRLGHGFGMIINHGNGWASHYANLQAVVAIRTELFRPRAQYVRAGDTVAYVGAPEPGAFKRLHFELWQRDRDRRFVPVDPRPHLTTWKLVEHDDALTPAPPVVLTTAA